MQKKLLVFKRSTRFVGFSQNAVVFATFSLKFAQNPKNMVVCTKSCQFWRDRQVLVVFHKMPQFLQLFAKNLVKILRHGSLHKKLLVFKRSTSFGGFSQNAVGFATFCLKFAQHPKNIIVCKKSC